MDNHEQYPCFMPNFLIIGAAKAGTTSLYHYLRQHPQIYMSPVKEPKFFALEGLEINYGGPGDTERMFRASITTIEAYCRLFEDVSHETALGEASTLYLYSARAPRRIHHYLPKVRLIAILRNPVDRAYSNFLYMRRNNIETISDFVRAFDAEEQRIAANWMPSWHYLRRGFYYQQLKRYYNIFDPAQIQIFRFEDLAAAPRVLLNHLYDFLHVDRIALADVFIKHNISGTPKSQRLHDLITKSNPIKTMIRPLIPDRHRKKIALSLRNRNLEKTPMSPQIRRQLANIYAEDILGLQDLTQLDLSAWLI